MYDDDQPEFVPADVEDREFPHLVGARVHLADVGELFPFGLLRNAMPGTEGRLRLRMDGPELPELLLGDDVHRRITPLAVLAVDSSGAWEVSYADGASMTSRRV